MSSIAREANRRIRIENHRSQEQAQNCYPNVEFRNCKRSSLFASISKSLESLWTFNLIWNVD